MKKAPNLIASIAILAGGIAATAHAEDSSPVWLQTRDQNPFVLASGLPAPAVVPAAGHWQIDATLSIANTELAQTGHASSLLFDAETRESRLSVGYAFDDRWSLRASLSHLSIDDGFLDNSIEDFHRAFGFDNGDRGHLGTQAPTIEVSDNGEPLYEFGRAGSAIGPMLVDLTRVWRGQGDSLNGISLGIKLATGSEPRLTDTGSTDLSFNAFTERAIGERWAMGARAGLLYQTDNTLLGDRARDVVPFASLMLNYRLGQRWSAIVQADAHGALYRDLPDFFASANTLSFGLARSVGKHNTLLVTLAEDLPALHTTDVVLQIGWRMRSGAR